MFNQASAAALAAALSPSIVTAATKAQVLKFVPQADLGVLDPIWTTAYITRNHGYLVYDTLYGLDDQYRVVPQMVQGHVVEKDGLVWKLTLRPGLVFHDNTPVRAVDVVASIKRWGKRDAFGKELLAQTDELSAPSDSVVQFRLKKPFPQLPAALGKLTSTMPCIMPERLARTDPSTQVTEIVGSGPYRLLAKERIEGSLVVYEKFAGYKPSTGPAVGRTGGPKIATLDRIEWHTMPDPATAAAALQAGEVDWVEQPLADLLPLLKEQKGIKIDLNDPSGSIGSLRLNHLTAPFNNPAIRRILLGVINQADFMSAVVGNNPGMSRTGVGVFTPGTPMASTAGMSVLTGPGDMAKAKAALKAAGYNGEPVVILAASDAANMRSMSDVAADTMKRLGMNVDYQSLDWGMVQKRRTSRASIKEGGWSCLCTSIAGIEALDPSSHQNSRGQGLNGQYGWPDSPKLEQYRADWLAAPTLAAQKAACDNIQKQVFEDVPYIPLGQFFQPVAYGPRIASVPQGFPQFYNVKMAG
ncbi:ABC transporter substrate-binding protein [Xylophilus rhododendri]|uniref:ABC transporter substrate-binding protein n=2 Tax=Xylophilus rhododendri TaxID=2697032 RepID=A0A857JCC2_9BURK|nr:ABC transporter substrate-binding protein [Xylophilus rhododendri]